MTVDLSPVVQAVVALGGTALSVLGSLVLTRLAAKFHVQLAQAQTATFDDALNKAITYGAGMAEATIAAKGWDHPTVKIAVLASALNYATTKFPDALAGVGLSGSLNDPTTRATITSALTRAYPAAMATAAASPVTPPASPTPLTVKELTS